MTIETVEKRIKILYGKYPGIEYIQHHTHYVEVYRKRNQKALFKKDFDND